MRVGRRADNDRSRPNRHITAGYRSTTAQWWRTRSAAARYKRPKTAFIRSWEQIDDDTLRIHYTTGVEPCYVLDHVDVVESEESVTVTLFEGSGEGDVACIEIARFVYTDVDLSAPLADRSVVDGSI